MTYYDNLFIKFKSKEYPWSTRESREHRGTTWENEYIGRYFLVKALLLGVVVASRMFIIC